MKFETFQRSSGRQFHRCLMIFGSFHTSRPHFQCFSMLLAPTFETDIAKPDPHARQAPNSNQNTSRELAKNFNKHVITNAVLDTQNFETTSAQQTANYKVRGGGRMTHRDIKITMFRPFHPGAPLFSLWSTRSITCRTIVDHYIAHVI